MKDLLREYIGAIALLIYILYPLLKRLFNRRKQQREQTSQRAETEPRAPSPSEPEAREPSRAGAGPVAAPHRPPPPPEPPRRPAQPDFLGAARTEVERLTRESSRLLGQAEVNPRLTRLVPALREDLLGRIHAIGRSLEGSPTLSTIMQETAALRELDELLGYLARMMRQRMLAPKSAFLQADRMVDDCYAPLLQFSSAQNLRLKTSQPVAVSGDWDSLIAPRFASARVAPVQLPRDFEESLWQWPALAAEVGRDFYFSVDHLEQDLHDRLGLPHQVDVPSSDSEVDGRWLARLFGPWLPEIFPDVMGTLMLGPAYVEMVRRAHRDPGSPQRTAAVFQDGSRIEGEPPARLRIYMAVRVLHHVGRHEEADALWEQWETEHPEIRLYFLPIGGRWAGVADHTLHSLADSLVDTLVQSPWPELEGFQLMNIPGFAYLHAEHAEVERLMEALARGSTVDADSRWIIAAAVLAAAAQPALHDVILDAAKRSIAGIERKERERQPQAPRTLHAGTIGEALVASLRSPDAIREAIVLGAALGPQRRRWR
ncbi:MAG: hypothetical protein WAU39_03540 [Polyangiales bacterium]